LLEKETQGDYTAVFATSSSFDENDILASKEIHLVLQLKKDLVLYEDQIIATTPGESDGKVINAPDNYELWSGEVAQGALVIGSGEWINSETGEYTGLSAGQHAIRAGEYLDKETNPFYFASDYDVFEVPRGFYTITADETKSSNVIFTEGTKQTSEPGGTVYFYVKPAEGYRVSGYSVSKESYINESRYDSENGYIVLEGISGSFEIVVLTETKVDNNTNSEQQNTDNGQNNGGNPQADQSTVQQNAENTRPVARATVQQAARPVQAEVVVEPVAATEEITVDTEDVPKAETAETVDASETVETTENTEITEIEDEQAAKADSYAGESSFKFWPILIVLLGAVLVLVAAVVKKNAQNKESN